MPMNILKQIWPEWVIGRRIGGGAYGTVYEASRSEYDVENHAAIKIISIPASEAEIDTLRSEGLDMQATRTHFQSIVNDFVNEIRLMVSLEGRPNIVNVKDYKVVEKAGEFGWHIFILMELLTPFAEYTCDHQMTESEVIKLGCDICTALETCAAENIIHRDIKPGNILIHEKTGTFKLGDFGIARKLENTAGGLSQRYTPKYMAPEVATSPRYDERVDIYSLGIVLYELLNGRRIPFQPDKQIYSLADIETAVRRRNAGEAIPAPSDASAAMAEVILRACAYDPDMRFATATEMKQALQSVANGTYQISVPGELDETATLSQAPENYEKTVSVRKAPAVHKQEPVQSVHTFGNPSVSRTPAEESSPRKSVTKSIGGGRSTDKKKKLWIGLTAIGIVAVMIAICIAVAAWPNDSEKELLIRHGKEAGELLKQSNLIDAGKLIYNDLDILEEKEEQYADGPYYNYKWTAGSFLICFQDLHLDSGRHINIHFSDASTETPIATIAYNSDGEVTGMYQYEKYAPDMTKQKKVEQFDWDTAVRELGLTILSNPKKTILLFLPHK